MNEKFDNKAAYDLTLEYFRQNHSMKESMDFKLENCINKFKNKYDEIVGYLEKL